MRCYTYNKTGKNPFTSGIDFIKYPGRGPKTTLKTAKLEFLVEPEYDMEYVIGLLKDRSNPDIYLYGVANFTEGDSESGVIPDTCFLLEVPIDCTSLDSDRSLPMVYGAETKLHLCYAGETYLLDTAKDVTIGNNDGTPETTKHTETAMNTTDVVVLEF